MKVDKAAGIAFYPGIGTDDQIEALIKRAAALGYAWAFTSLLLAPPEKMGALCRLARDQGLRVMVDASDAVFARVGAAPDDLTPFIEMGIGALRIDYGFGEGALAAMANNPHGIPLVLNLSTHARIPPGADPNRVIGCFNLYPRVETGHDPEFVRARVDAFGGPTCAFISTAAGTRESPIGEGRPTVECLRDVPPGRAASMLFALGVDVVMFGDVYATDTELESVAEIGKLIGLHGEKMVSLGIVPAYDWPDNLREAIIGVPLRARSDSPGRLLRMSGTRGLKTPPVHTATRAPGCVTVDNADYVRYAGELQIVGRELPADPRVNVIGYVDFPDLWAFVKPGVTFIFEEVVS